MRRRVAGVLGAVLVAGLVGACGGTDGSRDGATAQVDAETRDRFALDAEAGSDEDSGEAAGGGAGSLGYGAKDSGATASSAGSVAGAIAEVPESSTSVIKTAEVEVEVAAEDVDDAVRRAVAAAGRFGGFVVSSGVTGGDEGSASVVVRVPAESFERALGELEGLGTVTREVVSGRDVSQEFVDLEARIRNLEAQETVLLRLMERSQTVSDTIKVQRELQGVQLGIERLTGRLRYLRDQADMSTISISFVEEGTVTEKPRPAILAVAWERALSVALGVVAAVIVGTGALIPIAVLLMVVFLVLRAFRVRLGPGKP